MRTILPRRFPKLCAIAALVVTGTGLSTAASHPKKEMPPENVPELALPGGRRLVYERSFASDREVKLKRGFWTRVLDLVAGPPEIHNLVRPYSIAVDSRGRVIVTDPGLPGVHVFDFARQKYRLIVRDGKEPFRAPQCVAVDRDDNFYVTDSEAGKIFVFDADSRFRRTIGSLKGGEGFFKRPTGIAIDDAAGRIYVTDTVRQKLFVLDLEGSVLKTIGSSGSERGEFNFPTELKLLDQELYVVDAMNFRIQVLDLDGQVRSVIGGADRGNVNFFRPKGIGIDSERNLYVVDGLGDMVHVFDREGRLLYYFGGSGTGPEQFQLPAGLFINRNDQIYVVDSFNGRIQVLRYEAARHELRGARP
jgi:DNA-binding beta-propeller fold protein YncE